MAGPAGCRDNGKSVSNFLDPDFATVLQGSALGASHASRVASSFELAETRRPRSSNVLWPRSSNVLWCIPGINQGFAWSMTVIMKIDLVGPKSRGLAVGVNEFAGYLAVGITAFLTGYIAQRYGLRPAPIYLGVS
jgi:hypothetical protein